MNINIDRSQGARYEVKFLQSMSRIIVSALAARRTPFALLQCLGFLSRVPFKFFSVEISYPASSKSIADSSGAMTRINISVLF